MTRIQISLLSTYIDSEGECSFQYYCLTEFFVAFNSAWSEVHNVAP